MMRPGDSEWSGAPDWADAAVSSQSSRARSSSFGEVVAQLVGCVDAALHAGEFGISCAGGAGLVFDVPEVEVGAVLAGHAGQPSESCDADPSAPGGASCHAAVSLVVQFDDRVGRKHGFNP